MTQHPPDAQTEPAQGTIDFGRWANPTWREGYWARAMGWPLHPNATPAYEAGWRHSDAVQEDIK